MTVYSDLIEAHIIRIENNEPIFLLMKRADNDVFPGVWQMVTGTVEKNETGYKTAFREITEETGITPSELYVVPVVNSFYNPKIDGVCMVPVFAAVTKEKNITLSDEHVDYKWVLKEEAKELLAWQGQRNSVDIIHEYFTKCKSYLNFVEIPFET